MKLKLNDWVYFLITFGLVVATCSGILYLILRELLVLADGK